VYQKILMIERSLFPKIPKWCYTLCHNAGNDLCVEDCAEFRDARHLEPKDLNVEDMPRFPKDEFENEMTFEERKKCLALYMERLVDQAQGIRHEVKYIPRRRSVKVDNPHKDIFLSEI
jgi:hypothetical protein